MDALHGSSRQCFQKALKLLARRDYSIKDLEDKLKSSGFLPSQVEEAVSKCKGLNYLNDDRFSEEFILQYRRKGFGPLHIKQKLKSKGLNIDIITESLAKNYCRSEELDACKCVLAKKLRVTSDHIMGSKKKASLFRFLMGRGFHADVVRQVLDDYRIDGDGTPNEVR